MACCVFRIQAGTRGSGLRAAVTADLRLRTVAPDVQMPLINMHFWNRGTPISLR